MESRVLYNIFLLCPRLTGLRCCSSPDNKVQHKTLGTLETAPISGCELEKGDASGAKAELSVGPSTAHGRGPGLGTGLSSREPQTQLSDPGDDNGSTNHRFLSIQSHMTAECTLSPTQISTCIHTLNTVVRCLVSG